MNIFRVLQILLFLVSHLEFGNFINFCVYTSQNSRQKYTFLSSYDHVLLIRPYLTDIFISHFDINWNIELRKKKIRPQAKIDNFAFKNSNIIIEGLFWKRKYYFPWKKLEIHKNNFINKFYFCPNFFSYRFLSNFKKFCYSNKWINYYQI